MRKISERRAREQDFQAILHGCEIKREQTVRPVKLSEDQEKAATKAMEAAIARKQAEMKRG
jgi:hypothetical protein